MAVILGLSNRKKRFLTKAEIAEGTVSIGDAAFSFCESLKQIRIPASVEFIGVAAFCKSGLETVVFEGVPREIENGVFNGCSHLKQIVVPKGCKAIFVKKLGLVEALVVEADEVSPPRPLPAQPTGNVDLFGNKVVKHAKFNYNQQSFDWAIGDTVNLLTFFSGPTPIVGNPAYVFRRRALFIFLKSATAGKLAQQKEYEIPANVSVFTRKYQEKYGTNTPRVFVFVCDNGQTAKVYDEVQYLKTNNNCIIVKSLLRI